MTWRKSQLSRYLFALTISAVLSCSNPEAPDTGNPIVRTRPTITDTVPPQRIIDAVFKYDSVLTLQWTAPFDDAPAESVRTYQIKYSYWFIDSTKFWELAVAVVSGLPSPASPGSTNVWVFQDPSPGKKVHAAIRSVDEGDNVSELSNLAEFDIPGFAFSGECVDVVSGDPVKGLVVSVANRFSAITDAAGRFSFRDMLLDDALAQVTIEQGQATSVFHIISQIVDLTGDVENKTFVMIPFEDDLPLNCGQNVLDVVYELHKDHLKWLSSFVADTLRRWQDEDIPIRIHIPDDSVGGVDWDAAVYAAVEEWNAVFQGGFGTNAFDRVDTIPPVGVSVYYPSEENKPRAGWVEYQDPLPPADGFPVKERVALNRFHISSDLKAREVALHELGHVLGIGHSGTRCGPPPTCLDCSLLLMRAASNDFEITENEQRAVVLMYRIPNGTDLGIYVTNSPP